MTAPTIVPTAVMVPRPYRVAFVREETHDTVTVELAPVDTPVDVPAPGQFMMLWAFGVGEVPISVSGLPGEGRLRHTIRRVGPVTERLGDAVLGEVIGVRGPFGTGWDLDGARGHDALVMAGGLGLAPLRPVVEHLLERRDDFERVAILIGARSPVDLPFTDDVARWTERSDVDVAVTVDAAVPGWQSNVGVVTTLVPGIDLDPATTRAFVCGPEVMMRFAVRTLLERGHDPAHTAVSLERNMHCAVGHCGRCQLGPEFVCRNGPVFPWERIAHELEVPRR